MRTTLQISDHLYHLAKKAAAETRRTLTAVIEDALRETFSRRGNPPPRNARAKLPVFGGKGLQPGVDLDDGSSLMDLMDSHDSSRR
jgi:hypothetical protein